MFTTLIHKLSLSDNVIGIEYVSNGNSGIYNLVNLKISKKKFELLNSYVDITDSEELVKLIPVNTPVVMLVTGKGILSRTISSNVSLSDKEILNKIIPNADVKEFCLCYNNFLLESIQSINVSIVRKKVLIDQYEKLKNEGLKIIGFLVGQLNFENIVDPQKITEKNQNKAEESSIESGGMNKSNNIENADISNKALMAYTAAIHYFGYGSGNFTTNLDEVDVSATKFGNLIFFKNSLKYSVISLFVLLLINFVLYNKINESVNKKDAEFTQLQQGVLEFNHLQNDYVSRFDFMKQNGMFTPPKSSYYGDRIAASVPGNIMLSGLNIFPLDSKAMIDNTGKFHFIQDKLIISGLCKRSFDLNEWIKKLNTYNWIKKVNLADYSQESSLEAGVFKLEIVLK